MKMCVFQITDREGSVSEFKTPDTGPFECWNPAIAETRQRGGDVNVSPHARPGAFGKKVNPNPVFLRFESEEES